VNDAKLAVVENTGSQTRSLLQSRCHLFCVKRIAVPVASPEKTSSGRESTPLRTYDTGSSLRAASHPGSAAVAESSFRVSNIEEGSRTMSA